MSDYAIGAKPLSGTDRPSRRATKDRTCREPGCAAHLSMYNFGKYCSAHEPMTVPRTRGKKIA